MDNGKTNHENIEWTKSYVYFKNEDKYFSYSIFKREGTQYLELYFSDEMLESGNSLPNLVSMKKN